MLQALLLAPCRQLEWKSHPEQYNMNMICKAQMVAINKVLMVCLALYC